MLLVFCLFAVTHGITSVLGCTAYLDQSTIIKYGSAPVYGYLGLLVRVPTVLKTCSTMKVFGTNCPFIFQKGEHFVNETIGRIKTSTDAVKSVAETDLVIEAIVENLDVKKKLFSSLDGAAPQYVLI